jgi:NAD(P)-dependent dehydrogenase (short-subunit alcohol dehydrogenase family)
MHQPALYPGLAGKTVFITGGGSGIGAAITRAFAGQKARTAFVDIAAEASRALVADVASIRVNCVVPGWVMTERQKTMWLTSEADKEREKGQCLPARVMPEDIADMVLFLASDAAATCTAQVFIVDGGWV